MTQDNLIAQFNRICEQQRSGFEKYGVSDTIKKLSLMTRNLKDAQFDVSLEVLDIANSFSFNLLPNDYSHHASALMTIGNTQRMIAIGVNLAKPEERKIALSLFDPKFHLPADGRGSVYDLNDPEWPLQMQSKIVEILAINAVIAECDTHKAFVNSRADKKPNYKLFQK